MMKYIKTEEAAGHVLCHDITQIIPGRFKGTAFRKGHIVTAEDIPVLLSLGKENLYVWERKEGILHEDEAAYLLADLCLGDGLVISGQPREGKIAAGGKRTGRNDDRHPPRQFPGKEGADCRRHESHPAGHRRRKDETGTAGMP